MPHINTARLIEALEAIEDGIYIINVDHEIESMACCIDIPDQG